MFYSNEEKLVFENQLTFYNNNMSLDISIEHIKKEISLNAYDKRIFDKNKKNTQALRYE